MELSDRLPLASYHIPNFSLCQVQEFESDCTLPSHKPSSNKHLILREKTL